MFVQIHNDNVTLNLTEDGDAAAPPLLLLHGITSFGGTWEWIVPSSPNDSACCASTFAATAHPIVRPTCTAHPAT